MSLPVQTTSFSHTQNGTNIHEVFNSVNDEEERASTNTRCPQATYLYWILIQICLHIWILFLGNSRLCMETELLTFWKNLLCPSSKQNDSLWPLEIHIVYACRSEATPGGYAVWGIGLKPLYCWHPKSKSHWGHGWWPLMFAVCCVGSSLCNKLITCSKQSYQVCVSTVYDLENSTVR